MSDAREGSLPLALVILGQASRQIENLVRTAAALLHRAGRPAATAAGAAHEQSSQGRAYSGQQQQQQANAWAAGVWEGEQVVRRRGRSKHARWAASGDPPAAPGHPLPLAGRVQGAAGSPGASARRQKRTDVSTTALLLQQVQADTHATSLPTKDWKRRAMACLGQCWRGGGKVVAKFGAPRLRHRTLGAVTQSAAPLCA